MKTYATKIIVSLVALIAIVGGIFGYVARSKNAVVPVTDDTSSQPLGASTTTAPADVPVSTRTSKYKDGVYSAVGSYMSPGGLDDLNVTLTLRNGIVTDATVTSGAHDRTSSRYQSMFIGGYKAYVIGKSIDSINLDAVSGSSLTPEGFNDAVAKIKTEAQA